MRASVCRELTLSYRQPRENSKSELLLDSDFEEVSGSLLPEVVDWIARMVLLKI